MHGEIKIFIKSYLNKWQGQNYLGLFLTGFSANVFKASEWM